MEKNSDNMLNLSNLPTEIQQHIATYLDASALGFFAQSNQQRLQIVLPLLRQYQARFPLQLTATGHSTYLVQANQLFVCGYNGCGQLGLGDNEDHLAFTVVPWPEERGNIRQVIAGEFHTVVLTHDNRLWGCGNNGEGQLGLDDNRHRSIFTAVPWPEERGVIRQVIAGQYHTLVRTQDNRLWGCGNNGIGPLWFDDEEDLRTFTALEWPENRGRICQVIAGQYHGLVLTDTNQLWGYGGNYKGQLGLGDQALHTHSTFTAVPWPAERGTIRQIIAGRNYTLVLTHDNRLWGCGDNGKGQLGLGDQADRTTFTAVPWPEEQGTIQQIIAGGTHTVVLTDDQRLWVCGDNPFGQLESGYQVYQATHFTEVEWPEEWGQIRQVIAGQFHTLVLTDDHRLWGCGANDCGQLGLGDNKTRATFTPLTALPPVLQQVLTLNNHLDQLIKLGTALTLTPSTKHNILRTRRQPEEFDGQPLLKKRGCNLQ